MKFTLKDYQEQAVAAAAIEALFWGNPTTWQSGP